MALPKVRMVKASTKPRYEISELDNSHLRELLFSPGKFVLIIVEHKKSYRVAIDILESSHIYLLTPQYPTQDIATMAAQYMALNLSHRPS